MKNSYSVLSCRVDQIAVDDAIKEVSNAIENCENFHIVTINPEMIMNAQRNHQFMNLINNSELNIPDGVGVKLALKLKGVECNNIRGVDFARKLVSFANEKNLPIAFVGAKKEVIEQTCINFKNEYQNLNIVFSSDGYFKNDEDIIEKIKTSKPKILLIGLGSPKQEEFIVKLRNSVKGCAMIGVGGSFDVFSGLTKESPLIFQKLGLEWMYRTICQPERFKRIFPTLPIFMLKCIMESIVKRIKN